MAIDLAYDLLRLSGQSLKNQPLRGVLENPGTTAHVQYAQFCREGM
jgi:hypothetical protein